MNAKTALSTPGLTPEFALAAACCAQSIGITADLEALAARVQPDRFLAVLERHRIDGLAAQALALVPSLPPSMATALEQKGREVAEAGLRQALQCRDLRDAFAAEGVEMIFLKGLAIGKLAFGNALVKRSWDIDILVREEEVSRAATILKELGYAAQMRTDAASWHRVHKESTWARQGGAHVELHSRLADNCSLLPGVGLDSPRQHIEVVPGLALATLSGDDLLAYLAVHGASSAWFRLKWITEFAGVVRYGADGVADEVVGRLLDRQAGRAVRQAILLAYHVFGTPVSGRPCSEPAVESLVRVAMAQLCSVREPTERPLGTVTIHLSQLLLSREPGFKIRETGRQARDIAYRLFRP